MQFGDTWNENGRRARTTLLMDFHQKADLKMYNRLKLDKQERVGEAEALIQIEGFVARVLRGNGQAYEFKKNSAEFTETRLGKALRHIYPLSILFDSKHFYSEKPSLFLRACLQARSMSELKLFKAVRDPKAVDVRYAETMNLVIELIRKGATEEWFKRGGSNRRYQQRCNGMKAARYVADVLRHKAKTEIVRLDAGYVGGETASVSIVQAHSDFHDLIGLLEWHPAFKHLIGYMWSIEQGEDGKGYHMHLVLFFDGSKVCRDIAIGNFIGRELWVRRVSRGRGNFYNCNMHKQKYKYVGIGTIHRNNEEQCRNAVRCLQYLPKGGEFLDRDDQYLRIKHLAKMHTFDTGFAPEIAEKRRGRPASVSPWFKRWREDGKIDFGDAVVLF